MQMEGDKVRFGVHAGQQYATFDEYAELWRRSEELGYDWVSDFDHFRPPDGGPDGVCFEGLTLLSALAARTSRIRCGILVVAIAYRDPPILASIAATIDHVSGGRLELGLGAGGADLAHYQYGLRFPPIPVRLEILDEACRVMRSLWTRDSTTFEGKHFVLRDARLEPKPIQERLPIVIGGSGEKRMLRIVAEHADVWNTFAEDLGTYGRRLAALVDHCADIGRDPNDIRKSLIMRAVLAETDNEARVRFDELVPLNSSARQTTFVGTPEQFIEYLRPYRKLGVGDFLLGVRRPVDWQTIELVARDVAPSMRGARSNLSLDFAD